MAFLHLWCRKHLKWPHWREGKKERRELWLKIVPWNVRLFFIFSITNLLYDVPWANWKLVAYLHTDIKVEVNFLLWGEKIGRWENLRLRPILSFPIQVWRQWLKGWDIGRCKIRRRSFLMRRGQNVKANQLWSPEELRHVARAVVEARAYSAATLAWCYVLLHSFIPLYLDTHSYLHPPMDDISYKIFLW